MLPLIKLLPPLTAKPPAEGTNISSSILTSEGN